jgi:hypothetical protein
MRGKPIYKENSICKPRPGSKVNSEPLNKRRTFETLSSSGPFQELTSLTSNSKLWADSGSLPSHFHQSLPSSLSLELKAFDKQSTLVLMNKSEIVVFLG